MDSKLALYQADGNSMVVYHSEDDAVQLEVQLSDETVWLTQQQMMLLFETSKQNISLHINNIFREGELVKSAVVKDYLTTAADGKSYHVQYYNLDLQRHNQQYPAVGLEENDRYHDRFLVINETVYHLGASMKDLGKKLFAFSKMETPKEQIMP